MKFSKKELMDLVIAWFFISLAFAILFSGNKILTSINAFFVSLIISGFTVGIGFLFHELMHKFVAQKYGLWAEFQAFYPMLFLTLALSFAGFIIAAPGAVVIEGKVNKEKNGKISLAGPLTNIILSLIFLIPLLIIKPQGTLRLFFIYGLTINSLLAFFNLLPVLFFDGLKIYRWNKTIYFISIISAVILFILSYFL